MNQLIDIMLAPDCRVVAAASGMTNLIPNVAKLALSFYFYHDKTPKPGPGALLKYNVSIRSFKQYYTIGQYNTVLGIKYSVF